MQGSDLKQHNSTLRWIIALALVIIVLLVINLLDWSKADRPATLGQAIDQAQPPFAATLPYRRDDNEYVGSTSCRGCHSDEHKSWHASYHRSMTQLMSPETVQAAFDGQTHEFQGERFTMHRSGDEYWTSIESIDAALASPNGRDPQALHMRLGMVTGSHHMQVFWLPGMMGNLQIGFPFAWLIDDRRWAPRNSLFIRDPHTVISKENWNMNCIRCHTTGGQPRPLEAEQRFESRVADLGISCEACHGPAKRHVDRQQRLAKLPESEYQQALNTEPLAIVQPADLDHVRSSQVCGSCHGMKWFDKSVKWTAHGFRYRPGDDLEQTTPIIRPTQLDKQPWLKEVLQKNPDILNDFFWPDGHIRVTGREYNGLLESACYQRGKMSCISCHSMHKSDPDDQLARGMRGNQACLQCHDEMAGNITAHTQHAADSVGSNCTNCHMPHTSYGLLKAIRGHTIETPNVATTLETGRPNACNLCHLDKTLDWTAGQLAKRSGEVQPTVPKEHRTTAASVIWLLKGDAGQRALAAWHMGWKPALEASGSGWQSPLLAELLADPYSAVRYMAHKALTRQPGFEGFEYDFVADETSRLAKRKTALAKWTLPTGNMPTNPNTLLLDTDGQQLTNKVRQLIETRDNRPMRLRE